ncbi:hypothetical protein [Streptomyces sp. WG7]|uniref:hypothetical protein n=1 Tax=Streptomyces sp. WG7 TaxID=3417650 RepID=UPI003CEDE719
MSGLSVDMRARRRRRLDADRCPRAPRREDRAAPAGGVTRELRRRVEDALDWAGTDSFFPRRTVRVRTDTPDSGPGALTR